MYADKITESMQLTIDETDRRRQIQLAYNEEHGITPQAIVKARNRIIGVDTGEEDIAAAPASPRSGKPAAKSSRRDGQAPKVTYESEYTTRVDIAADPVIPYMTCEELQRSITRKRVEMVDAAKRMEFIEAARLRDEVLKMEELLKQKEETA